VKKEYTYRLLNHEDVTEINELFKSAFQLKPKENFIQWKYFSNPLGNAILAGAFYNDKLVGSGAMIPEKMNIFNKQEIVYKCTDLMTNPEHQRKGISKKINELLSKEISAKQTPFSYTLCSKVSTKSFIKNNWIFVEEVINFFKPYAILKINTLLQKIDPDNYKFHHAIENHLDGYNFREDKLTISVQKSLEFLKWRTSNPNFTYRIICSYDNNKQVNGYLIYSISANNLLNIIDLESSTNDKVIESQLMACAEYIAVKEKYRGILVLTINKSPFYDFIKGKHYFRNPFRKGPLKTILDFDVHIYNKHLSNVSLPSIWNLNGMSYDDI